MLSIRMAVGLIVTGLCMGEVVGQVAIEIRLFDYAGLPPAVLSRARQSASYILDSGGVHVTWAECRVRAADSVKDAVCEEFPTAAVLHVRILTAAMARRTAVRPEALGYAVIGESFPTIASVFLHRAIELEQAHQTHRADILGAIMAHEIAHLLLSSSNHSSAGVLRADWSRSELKLLARGRLMFAPGERLRLTQMVASRCAAVGKAQAGAIESTGHGVESGHTAGSL
jgi:hypothetical protein